MPSASKLAPLGSSRSPRLLLAACRRGRAPRSTPRAARRTCSTTRRSRPYNAVARPAARRRRHGHASRRLTADLQTYQHAVARRDREQPARAGDREEDVRHGARPREVIYSVVGTPDNIANLDAGRNDAAFWRGVREGNISTDEGLAAVAHRPAFAWVTATPHGNEPAAGEAIMRLLYELAARTGLLQRAPAAEPDDVHRPGHATRTAATRQPAHDGVGLRSQPRPRHAREHGERRLHGRDRQVPGRVLHRRPPAGQRVLLPAQRGRRPPRDLAVRAGLHPERHRPGAAADVQRPERSPTRTTTPTTCSRPSYGDTRPGAARWRGGHDLREGLERELRQAGLRPLPGDGRDGSTSRPTRRSASSTGWVKQWGEAREQGAELPAAAEQAGQPAAHADLRSSPGHRRLRLLLPARASTPATRRG